MVVNKTVLFQIDVQLLLYYTGGCELVSCISFTFGSVNESFVWLNVFIYIYIFLFKLLIQDLPVKTLFRVKIIMVWECSNFLTLVLLSVCCCCENFVTDILGYAESKFYSKLIYTLSPSYSSRVYRASLTCSGVSSCGFPPGFSGFLHLPKNLPVGGSAMINYPECKSASPGFHNHGNQANSAVLRGVF